MFLYQPTLVLAEKLDDEKRMIVSSRSTKQRAKDLALDSVEINEIAKLLGRPTRTIKDWMGAAGADV